MVKAIMAGVLGLKAALGGAAVYDGVNNEGHWLQTITGGVFGGIGKGQEEAKKEAGAHGLFKLIDKIFETLQGFEFFKDSAFLKSGRNWAQKLMGIPEEERVLTFGEPPQGATPGQNPNAAPPKTNPSDPNSTLVTPENEYSIKNLGEGLKVDSPVEAVENVVGKASLVARGAANEVNTTLASVAGHIADGVDWLVGSTAKDLIGYDNGYQTRNFSADFVKATEEHFTFKPELTTAWDRVAFNAGKVGVYAIPAFGGAGLATQAAIGGAAALSSATANYDFNGSSAPAPVTP